MIPSMVSFVSRVKEINTTTESKTMTKSKNTISIQDAVKRINIHPYKFAYVDAAIYTVNTIKHAIESHEGPVTNALIENYLLIQLRDLKAHGAAFEMDRAMKTSKSRMGI